jgi:hypothetical protein
MLGGLVFFLLPLVTLVCWCRSAERDWRVAWVWASLAWAGGISIATELLGACHELRFWPVLVLWLTANAALAALAVRAWPRAGTIVWPVLGSPFMRALAVVLGVLLGLALVAAAFSSPNTPDVLDYHLPRQLYWLQQGGVAHFLTDDDRALMMPPLAEMIQVHAMVLAGGDGWANVPQWLSYGLGMIVASLLVREFGGGSRGQWLAAVIFGTLPMAYHEASSAKNDLMVAVWLGVFAGVTLRLVREDGRKTGTWLAAGAALGLAIATKSTAFLFGPPIALVAVKVAWRNPRGAVLLVVVALLLTGPYLWRNQQWYGTPLGIQRGEDGGAQATETRSWRSTASNLLRNSTLHLATPSPALNARLAAAVARIHAWLGQDVNDRRTTLWIVRYDVLWAPDAEPRAGAPVQWLLGVGAIAWLLVRGPRRGPEMAALLMAVGGAVLFCLLLKWQPWGARLHLPVFLVLAALTARVAERLGPRAMILAAGLCVAGWLPSAQTRDRPLWSSPTIFSTTRWEDYFRLDPQDRVFAETALRAIRSAGVKSLQILARHSHAYPIMRGYLAENGPEAMFWSELPGALAAPAAGVLLLESFGRPLPLYLQPAGTKERYRAAGETDPYGLYLPESRARALAATLPLPRFVGWEPVAGFGPSEMLWHDRHSVPVRRMDGSAVKINFRRTATAMSVRLRVANTGATPCVLRLQLDGRRIATLRLEPAAEIQEVQVPLAPTGEQGELTWLAEPAAAAGALVFFSVQIDDR